MSGVVVVSSNIHCTWMLDTAFQIVDSALSVIFAREQLSIVDFKLQLGPDS
jgi:hypothetical protein